jgi:hypothetical protein
MGRGKNQLFRYSTTRKRSRTSLRMEKGKRLGEVMKIRKERVVV